MQQPKICGRIYGLWEILSRKLSVWRVLPKKTGGKGEFDESPLPPVNLVLFDFLKF